jgi:polysaccharide pyruvyl transferase WcaK-like protein
MSPNFLIYTASGAKNLGDECILASEILLLLAEDSGAYFSIATYNKESTQSALFAIFSKVEGLPLDITTLFSRITFIPYFPNGLKKSPLKNLLSLGKNLVQTLLSDEIIIGGGWLIYDVEKGQSFTKLRIEWEIRIFMAKLLWKPLRFWNIGIDVTPENLSRIKHWFTGKQTQVFVRDSHSESLLKQGGIAAKKNKDSVFFLPLKKHWVISTPKYIGIACREGYLQHISIEDIVEVILNHGYTPIFISHSLHETDIWSNDYESYKSMAQKYDLRITKTLEESLEVYSEISGIISMRLHANILAIQMNLPFFPISYSKKTEFILKDIGVTGMNTYEKKDVFLQKLELWLMQVASDELSRLSSLQELKKSIQ